MNIFDRYIFKNLLTAALFVALVLVALIMLTQSLRFLELVMDSGASGLSFWILTFLALPRFLEIILPLAVMAGVLFVYNRMMSDSELTVIRAMGRSPLGLAKPALVLALIVTIFLWGMTLWAAPKSLSQMQHMRQVIKAQFSAFLLRDGVFNKIGSGLTVYIREKIGDEELRGILIHDTRDPARPPSTVMAKSGKIALGENGYEVLVFNGSRQEINAKTGILQRLNFDRYIVELPDSAPVRQRWKQPDERTITELITPNLDNKRDRESLRDFRIELHRRITGPVLSIGFTLVACAFLLLGGQRRRGYTRRILAAIAVVMLLQSLFLASSNLARGSDGGLILMYLVTLGPVITSTYMLSALSEKTRRIFRSRIKRTDRSSTREIHKAAS